MQALPTVICFIDAKVVDRIVGFDELGNTDEFDVCAPTVRHPRPTPTGPVCR